MQQTLLLRSNAPRKNFVPCFNEVRPGRVPRCALPRATPPRREDGSAGATDRVQSLVSSDGAFDADKLDVDTLQLDDPFGMVRDVMTSTNLRCATPDQPLSSAASKLDKITGLAVVDEENVVVGVVSIKVSFMDNKKQLSIATISFSAKTI